MALSRSEQSENPKIIPISDKNIKVYINLACSYEAEFSSLTHKMPNEFGIFEPDTMPSSPYTGYLLYYKNIPIGFCVAKINKEINDIAEFYIIPAMRKQKFGCGFAMSIFDRHPGKWQVREIAGADSAISFWRKVIKKFTHNEYQEAIVTDPQWGVVTRQQFVSGTKKKFELCSERLSAYRVFSPAGSDTVIKELKVPVDLDSPS
ncbi:MAG: GNAT family N-acetyltransferase [Gammaproteobacteria bacterium]